MGNIPPGEVMVSVLPAFFFFFLIMYYVIPKIIPNCSSYGHHISTSVTEYTLLEMVSVFC